MKRTIFLPVFLLLAATAFAFNLPTDLRGIKTVNVMVAGLSDELVQAGVDRDALAAALQDALKKAGLATLTQGQFTDTVPTVSLQVTAVKGGRFFATDVVLSCVDNVYGRSAAGPITAAVWSKDVLQLLGAVDLKRVLDAENGLLEMFLSDYAQGNPR